MGFFDFIGDFAGDIIGAGAGLLGDKFNRAGVASQNQANRESGLEAAKANAALQKEFAQHGVRWKVRDAKAAGLHPLAALGMQPVQATPVYQGSMDDAYTSNTLANFGQDISRSINATRTRDERASAIDTQADQLRLDNMSLQNDLLRAQIAGSKAALLRLASNPAFPGAVVDLPSENVVGSPGAPARQPGQITDYQFTAPDAYGNPGIVPSADAKQRIEDDFIAQTLWHLQHRLIAPPHPDNTRYFNPFIQKYVKRPEVIQRYLERR